MESECDAEFTLVDCLALHSDAVQQDGFLKLEDMYHAAHMPR